MPTKSEIAELYIEAENSRNFAIMKPYVTENFVYQHHDGPKFGWERHGLDSMQDHTDKIMIPIIPDRRTTIRRLIESENEVWLLIDVKATITGKVDFGDYVDSNREPTNRAFHDIGLLIFEFKRDKLDKTLSFPSVFDAMLKMNIIKFVDSNDDLKSYRKFLKDKGIIT